MKNEPLAALLFGDREYSEMLRYELLSCGFEIAKNEKEADIHNAQPPAKHLLGSWPKRLTIIHIMLNPFGKARPRKTQIAE